MTTQPLIVDDVIGLARALFEEIGDALFLLDPDTDNLLDVNPMVLSLTGFTRAEIMQFQATYLFRFEATGGMQRLQGAFTKTMVFHSQDGFLLRTKESGVWIPVNLTVSRLHMPPKPLGLIIARDDRDRRAAFNQTRRAEAELRKVLASSPAALWSAERTPGPDVFAGWQFRYVSPLLSRLAGRPNEFFDHPLKWIDVVHTADRDAYRALYHRLLVGPDTEIETTYRVVAPAGTIRWVRDKLQVIRDTSGRPTRLDGCLNDITEQRQADEALRQNEQRFRALVERSRDVILLLDDKSMIKYASPSMKYVMGFDPAIWPGRHARQLLEEADHTRLRDCLAYARTRPGEDVPLSAHAKSSNGGDRYIEINLCNRIDDPSVRAVVINFRDITERELAARDLASQHALLAGLFSSLPDMICYKDRELRFIGGNPAFEILAGRPVKELVGLSCELVFKDEWAARVRDLERQVLSTRKTAHLEESIQLPNGKRILMDFTVSLLLASDGSLTGLIIVGRDLTERKHLEDQLRQSQKLEAVGQLAGGVAHDFNNLLTVILGNLELARSGIPGLDIKELLASTEEAGRHAAELTRQMLGFARRQPLRLEAIALSRISSDTIGLLRRTIDPRVLTEHSADPELWPVLADAGQIQQVVMNLCLNARDAMPKGGRLTLRVENVTLDEKTVRRNVHSVPGDFVLLSVADTGTGMPPDVLERMFEPFFTTKPIGQGTGLGLAVVFGIVQGHHGWIDCESEVGKGTRIDVLLPRAAVSTPGSKSTSDENLPLGHGETILLVDDEALVRDVARNTLSGLGYHVLTARDGVEAIVTYEREKNQVQLVVMDLTMPNISGREAFLRIRAIDPSARVLFASGHSEGELLDEELDLALGFLSKPYTASTLGHAVRKALKQEMPAIAVSPAVTSL